MEVVSLVQLT